MRAAAADCPLPAGSASFASPKSSTFTTPSGVTLMFAGFRSRWMMPCSCAASSASAIWRAIGSASSSGIGAARDPIGQRLAFDQFEHERVGLTAVLETVDRGNVRMIERRQHLRLALEARDAIGIERERVGDDLQRDVATELRIARAIDLAHAAGAEGGEDDFIRTETGAACNVTATDREPKPPPQGEPPGRGGRPPPLPPPPPPTPEKKSPHLPTGIDGTEPPRSRAGNPPPLPPSQPTPPPSERHDPSTPPRESPPAPPPPTPAPKNRERGRARNPPPDFGEGAHEKAGRGRGGGGPPR